MKNKKEKIEFRYFEIPQKLPLMALLGERWVTKYGKDPMHFHNYMEIGYCYFGEGIMHFGKEKHPYGPGTITVIPKNFPHHTNGRGDALNKWEYLYIDTERFIKEAFLDKPVYVSTLLERLHNRSCIIEKSQSPMLDRLILGILDEMRNKEEFYQDSVRGLLLPVLMNIVRRNPMGSMSVAARTDNTMIPVLMEVLDYIEAHYKEKIKVEELALIGHMSETHFRRIFKEYVNFSPAEYMNLVRIRKACELLIKSDERLEDIALKTGFQASATFIRNFKKLFGEAPHTWRNLARKDEDNPFHYNISVLKGW